MPGYSLKIAPDSPKEKKILQKLVARLRIASRGHTQMYDKWRKAEEITLAYVPESEADLQRRNDREVNGVPRYTTIQVPYSYALLMSAHTYWTSVFFARSPVHQYSGRHGEGEMQVQAMEALIDYQVECGAAMAPYYIWLYDAGKYGVGWLGTYWQKEKIHYGQIVEMQDPATGQMVRGQMTQEVIGYEGNTCYNASPWDVLTDPRVSVTRFQEGEFMFVRRRLGWNQILRRQDQGYFMNIDKLKEHVTGGAGDRTMQTNLQGDSVLLKPDFTSSLYTHGVEFEDEHPAGAVLWEAYVDLVPSEWGLGSDKYPQKWCFTMTADEGLLIGASPLGYVHGKFPFDVLESEIEGYGLYNRGIPEIIQPIQNTMDWLLNTHFFNVRAALNNQFILDPSKIVIKDAANAGPGFIWRLRPEAYGQDIRGMFYQVPVSDVTRSHLSDFQAMLGVGEKTLGINDQIMGALSTGGRKTATEVRTSTGFGVNRLKTVTEYMSATGFSPHSQKLVQSSQQFYDQIGKLRRVGSLAVDAGMMFMDVRPEDIAGYFDFVNVDGTLPVDRMAQANLWKEIMSNIARMPPQVIQEYDWSRIFAWTAQLAGLKNIRQFKIQVLPDQQLQQQAQLGNVIPMPQRQLPSPGPGGVAGVESGNSASTAAGLNALPGAAATGGGY